MEKYNVAGWLAKCKKLSPSDMQDISVLRCGIDMITAIVDQLPKGDSTDLHLIRNEAIEGWRVFSQKEPWDYDMEDRKALLHAAECLSIYITSRQPDELKLFKIAIDWLTSVVRDCAEEREL